MKYKRKRVASGKSFSSLTTILLIILGVTAIGAAVYVASFIRSVPSPDQFSVRRINQSTKIFDRTGEILLYEIHGEEKRTIVPFEEIPEWVKKATLAAEDINFYNQPAFDWKAIVRALLVDIRERRFAQGGSTITQQLAKNIFLSPEKKLIRKIKELILAIQLESKYTKDQILYFYLNQIPYGSNAYGVEAASQIYFGKSVRDVSIEEAATLASLLKAPSYYSPWGTHTKELFERKDYVLDRMAEYKFISGEEAEMAKIKDISFLPPSLGTIKAPHFSLMVRDALINKYGEDLITNGGLKVTTTLDWEMQKKAERAVFEGSENNMKLYGSSNAALVAQDPKSGQILALVGSRNYFDTKNEGNFNVATQGLRQPGSALKPFVYLTAFQKGYSPQTIVFDVSTEFDTRDTPETSYRPSNFDGKVRGPVRLENALAESLNIPAVKVLYLAGQNDALKNLYSFGISTLRETWRYGLSLVLGGGEVKLFDLVGAYSVLSQDGVLHRQTSVLRVENPDGDILEEYKDSSSRVVEEKYPRIINGILANPSLRAPIFGSSLSHTVFPGYDVAIKTGTSEDHRDAWTIGYTPFLVVGVWAGNNDNSQMIRQGSSILAAVPILGAFMKDVIYSYTPESFQKSEQIPYTPKPMLNGDYMWRPIINGVEKPQIHSILFYVDKNDPLGPIPENPLQDVQFKNWEAAVREWSAQNIYGYSSFNQHIQWGDDVFLYPAGNAPEKQQQGASGLVISDVSPKNGDFISSPLKIQASIASDESISSIELYINRRLIHRISPNELRFFYSYTYSLQLDPQSVFEIRAQNISGLATSTSFIVYKQ